MNEALRRKRLSVLSVILLGIFIGTSFTLCGCEGLKKKFIRQKKKNADEASSFVPVLEPEEYPEQVKTTAQTYRYHYSLWRVWNKDLQDAIFTRNSDKKQLYLADELINQLTEMKNILQGDKQAGLAELIKKLEGVRIELQKPEAMRNYTDISKDLHFISHKMFDDYKFTAVESSLIQ